MDYLDDIKIGKFSYWANFYFGDIQKLV